MISFRHQYDDHRRVFQPHGESIHILYSPHYTEDGTLELKATGTEDLYEQIQSHKESCDIHEIVNRFVAGDESVLSRAQGFYADASDMPKTWMEVMNSVIAGEHAFNSLPVAVKQQFGNSFSTWLSSFESPDFAEKMGFAKPPQTPDSVAQDFVSSTPTPSATVPVATSAKEG